ncbi:LacI family transcriptional regulator [Lysinibacillus yapensis]|uniref:LacI family transcriptional regulator n=1 Tax=Ureibacillus yapensis TaxID=2304605 RepID=A0A396SAB7_9BACL|nr:LacI family DNA-binding transcriptional regulator [Lysinibacillus yapensis]RHW36217.1 LacI family transcriptional regulator [Lysinibacillus yapensis]
MGRITINDVAKEASVSKSTVSQFLNNRYEYMSEETRGKIAKAIEKLNYQPNIVARSLKQKSTKTIGVIVANIVHTFSTHIINQLEMHFHEQGFNIMVCNAGDEPKREREHIEMLIAKQVDGIIAFPTGGNIDLYKRLYESRFPIVFIDRKIDSLPIPSVLLDNLLASSMAVDAFVKKGYKQIAIITNSIDQPITPRIERLAGFKEALEKQGLPITEQHIKAVPVDEVQETIEMLMKDIKPDAILAANDRVLIELLRYVRKKGLKIPQDLGVIGIDEVPYASFFEPPISTIEQPADQIALQASTILVKQISNQYESNSQSIYRFDPLLNERQSY